MMVGWHVQCLSPNSRQHGKLVCYGYGYGEVTLPEVAAIDPRVKIVRHCAKYDPSSRAPMLVSLGCHVSGAALPHPNTDPLTMEAGVRRRFLATVPDPVAERHAKFLRFTRDWVRKLPPIDPFADTSVDCWLLKTSYPESRKEELRVAWSECQGVIGARERRVKSFIKDETYVEYKHARAINSRTDAFKCAVGPIFKLIEEEVFKNPAFIKKVPIADRPRYIYDRLYRVGAKYFWADYTSMEAHFTKLGFECEFILYEHLTKFLPDGKKFMKLINKALRGTNTCVFKWLTVVCDARRMSGEMNTSLGNGFVNLMALLFLFSELGEDVSPVVEGDDSDTSFMVKCPTKQDFASLGFTVKCGVMDNFEEMSFCGMVFDPIDLINVTDPAKACASFGWARSVYVRCGRKRLNTLLRCKALSYAHQFPGCPIIQELAKYALRCTRSYDVRSFVKNSRCLTWWERENLLPFLSEKVPDVPVPYRTRLLVERLYGITVEQQISTELYLQNLTTIQPLVLPFPMSEVWCEYYDKYSHVVVGNDLAPPCTWFRMNGFVPEFR